MSDVRPVFEKIPVRVGELFTLRADVHPRFSGLTVMPHYHMMHELMWFRAARGVFTLGGEQLPLNNNTLVFVPALMIHDLTLEEQCGHARFLLQFEKEWLDELMLNSSLAQRGAVLVLAEQDAERLQMLFAWCSELYTTNNGRVPLFNSLIKSILLTVFNHIQASGATLERVADAHLDVLLHFLYQLDSTLNYSITTEEAARACHWSKSWFSRTFKGHFGMSFKSFMLLRKINIAVRLLSGTDMRISDISSQAGFTDSAYFCLKFRQILNETPLTFREKVRSTQEVAM